ncbi:MAG: flagellar biosynthesis anti-sigma factor FlgM [Pseudomonadota bacterium]|nr:flagellar biosynthesis anti-sigma factor FlgM [Pseudomonadota bacterium]
MPSKISGYDGAQPLAPLKITEVNAVADKASSDAVAVPATFGTQSADHLTLTESARTLQKIAQAIAQMPVADAAKVTAIRESLDSGTYRIDAGRIADGLLRFERGLK